MWFWVLVGGASAIDHAVNITVYHVVSASQGVIPKNMDTSSLNGDIFFDLRSITLPVECGSPYARAVDCENTEIASTDDVISKLVLEVDSRFGEYGKCNLCTNGTDVRSGLACEPGAYFCVCGPMDAPYECTDMAVGRENISESFDMYLCSWDQFFVEPWSCWSLNVWKKTGGIWYSTFASGMCPGDNCTWRVVDVEKVVTKNCSDDRIFSSVEAVGVDCFGGCGPRNTSSPCWIGCFYQTVLGPNAMLPTGQLDGYIDEGMPLADLADAWTAALDDCPAYANTSMLLDAAFGVDANRMTAFARKMF